MAVKGADATPEALVATVIVAVALLNVPLAPEPGAVKVTFTPDCGLLLASFTVTASALVKAVLTVALCGVVPAFAIMVGPTVTTLVRCIMKVLSVGGPYGPPTPAPL